jgi:hypothetical protein
MLTVIRRIFGVLLTLQCAGMLGFDLWMFSDMDIAYFRQFSAAEQTTIIGMAIVEAAGIALGLWLIFAKPRNGKGENRLEK